VTDRLRERLMGALALVAFAGVAWWRWAYGPPAADLSADAFLLVACLLLVAAALPTSGPGPGRARGLPGIVAGVMLLVAVAARPLFDAPFDTDAPVLRAAFAAVDVFGDWNHPFLPYLLNRPATWVSLEPRVLRVVPFLFLCAETAIAVRAAARDGGPLAGALCGVWFACEVPRRHGLSDLGDWDVAGAFLMALLAWTQRRDPPRAGAWVALAALLVAGVYSSWLMIVAASVLVACLAWEAWRGRLPTAPVAAVGLLLVALACSAWRIFLLGHDALHPGHAREVARGMLVESPVGRSAVMAVPAALGVAWAAAGLGRLSQRFTLGALLAVPVAVAVAFRWSHVNGGYYVGLVTPLLCYVSAVATAKALDACTGRPADARVVGARWHPSAEVRGLFALVLGLLTVDIESGSAGTGWEYLRTFSRQASRDRWPILTNSGSLARAISFERARAGDGPIAAAIDPPSDLARRIRLVDRADCSAAVGQGTEPGFYLVHLRHDDPDGLRVCLGRYGARCHEMQPPAGRRDRTAWFYRCDGVAAR
jgi:hypothetical protein